MKRIILILLFIPVFGFSQEYTDFLPDVAWRTLIDSVIFQNTDTFTVKVNPLDLNDPGAFEKEVGNFLIDNKRRKYKIIDNSTLSDGILITVVDVFESGAAPFQGLVGFVVESPNGSFASGLSTYFGEKLDELTADYERAIDLRIAYEKGQTIPNDSSRLWTEYSPTGTEPVGTSYYDNENRTISVALGNGVVMQINQESLIKVHNGTADTLEDGRILGYLGIVDGEVSVKYASNYERHIFLAASTERIPPDSIGLAVSLIGRVNNVNTGTLLVNPVYLDTAGYVTNEVPSFPKYNYPIGAVLKTGVTDGVIQFRSDQANYQNSIRNAFDGSIRESFDFRTYSDGVNVYGVLSNPNGRDSLTLMFSDGWFDHTVPDTIQLIAGTSTDPQLSYVYIDKETRTLQTSTSAPTNDFEYAQIAKIALLDAASTQTYGALRNQNINNHLKSNNDNGHIVHIGDRVRVLNAQWENGVGLTVSGTPTNLYLSTTSGNIWQMHLQSFAAQSMPTDDIHIVNHPTTPYITTSNLNTVTTYSDGSTWNNEWQNLVIWGVGNKTGEAQQLMCNLSSDGYTSEEDAIEDRNNYASYVIPREFRGVGFLIARITVRRSPSGYTYNPGTGYLDLRGYYPNNTAGGGTGSSGITEFTQLDDTPSAYTGQAYKFVRVNSGETALEFVDGSQILLTEFDSTGFTLTQSQIENLDSTLGLYWRNDGSSVATGDWDIGSNDFSAHILNYTGGQLGGIMTNSSAGLNLRTNTGFTSYSSETSNSPITGSGSILTQRYGDFANQIAMPESFGYPRIFARSGYFGVYDAWFNWAEIITDQNISDFETDPIALDSINSNLRPDIDENIDSISALSARSLQNESDMAEALALDLQDITDNGNTTTNSITIGGFSSNGNSEIVKVGNPYFTISEKNTQSNGFIIFGDHVTGNMNSAIGRGAENSLSAGNWLNFNGKGGMSFAINDVMGLGTQAFKITPNGSSTFYYPVTGTSFTGTSFTDGFITISLAQINRVNNNVEMQASGSGGVRLFGGTSSPITFFKEGNATFLSNVEFADGISGNDGVTIQQLDGTGTTLDIVANSLDADAYYLSGSPVSLNNLAYTNIDNSFSSSQTITSALNVDLNLNSSGAGTEIDINFNDTDVNKAYIRWSNFLDKFSIFATNGINMDSDVLFNSRIKDENGDYGTTGQVLSTTATGVDWIDQSSGGVTDHSLLSNLDYASAGHTGFVSTGTTQTISGAKTFSSDVTLLESSPVLYMESTSISSPTLTMENSENNTGSFQFTLNEQFSSNRDILVPDEAYSSSWNGSLEVPTKNAVYDKIETLSGSSFSGAKTTRTSNLTISSSGTDVTYTTETFDTDSYYSATNSERFTISTTGYYRISFHGYVQVATNLGGLDFSLIKNTATEIAYLSNYDNDDTNLQSSISYSDIHYLTSGDYVRVELTARNSNATLVSSGTELSFSIEKL